MQNPIRHLSTLWMIVVVSIAGTTACVSTGESSGARSGADVLTQEDLAKLVGVSRQTIISIERYKYIPGLDLGLKISSALEIKMEKVFYFV